MIAIIILSILVGVLLPLAGWEAQQIRELKANPPVQYKEIEVIKRAVCECKHVSSMHDSKGKCQEESFYIDGVRTSLSTRCKCMRYTGPKPITEYFDDQLELETTRAEPEAIKPRRNFPMFNYFD